MVYTVTAAVCNQDQTYKEVKFDMELSDVKKEGDIWEGTRNCVLRVAKEHNIFVAAVGLIGYKVKS
jgi:hypothetical protein